MEIHRPCFFRISSYGKDNHHHKLQAFSASSWKMALNSNYSGETRNLGGASVEHQQISLPQFKTTSPSNLHFNPHQPFDQESFIIQEDRIEFGQFVIRQALLDEEFWAAAWLRAETQWEDKTNDRYVENYKRKFAEQEFNALKRRSKKRLQKHKYSCIVTVQKEESKIVGTLDLSIRYLSTGETFPGERTAAKAPIFYSIEKTEHCRHGYIDYLCVAKSARRQGIASNMLLFAINLAESSGAKRVYLHVYGNNKPALELYQKMGFQEILVLQGDRILVARFDKIKKYIKLSASEQETK